jgi:hypothetical protein
MPNGIKQIGYTFYEENSKPKCLSSDKMDFYTCTKNDIENNKKGIKNNYKWTFY